MVNQHTSVAQLDEPVATNHGGYAGSNPVGGIMLNERAMICCPKCGSFAEPNEVTYVCLGECGWWIKFEDWSNYEHQPNEYVFTGDPKSGRLCKVQLGEQKFFEK